MISIDELMLIKHDRKSDRDFFIKEKKCPNCLSVEVFYDVVCNWHGCRCGQKIYLDPFDA